MKRIWQDYLLLLQLNPVPALIVTIGWVLFFMGLVFLVVLGSWVW